MKVHIHATGQYSLNGTADEFLVVLNRMNVTGQEILDHRGKMGHDDDVRHQVDFMLPEVSEVWNEGPIWQGSLPPAERVSTYEAKRLDAMARDTPEAAFMDAQIFGTGVLRVPGKPKKPVKAKVKKKVRR